MRVHDDQIYAGTGRSEEGVACWYAIWVRSQYEHLVRDQLVVKSFDVFLPEVSSWTIQADERGSRMLPLFPGCLFVHHAMDRPSHVRLLDTRGVVRILGGRWDRLAGVPERDVDAVRRLVESGLAPTAHPYLREGCRVRIAHGPLLDVEGLLVRPKPNKCLFVVSIELLQRSVAVEVDCACVVAA